MLKKILILLTLPTIIMASPLNKPLTVILDWFTNPNHAPLYVAKQQGYFAQEGIKVDIISPADSDDPPKLVASGKADIALDYQPNVIMQVANGLPILQVGTLIGTPLTSILTLKSSHIDSVKALKGKTIAGSSNNLVLRAMLKNNGIALNEVHIVNVHYNLIQALLSKKVDAASGMDRNIELIELQQLHQRVNAFYPEENHVPTYSGLVFVINRAEKNDPRIPRFLKAVTLGAQYLINHPMTTWQRFAKNHPSLNNALNKAAWFATLPRFSMRPGLVDFYRLETYARFMQQQGLIKKIPEPADLGINVLGG